ncbi:trp operon leader peptide [Salmonella enterica]|nr:trp operon leader peptide [Salmonella enterica]
MAATSALHGWWRTS